MPWTVVKFLATNEVEAVPTSWVDKYQGTCFNPTVENANAIQRLIKHEKVPEENWQNYLVEVMGQEEYTTYKIDTIKASRACKVSDLDEHCYSPLPEKRYRKKKIYSSSPSDSEESLQGVPKFTKKVKFSF